MMVRALSSFMRRALHECREGACVVLVRQKSVPIVSDKDGYQTMFYIHAFIYDVYTTAVSAVVVFHPHG